VQWPARSHSAREETPLWVKAIIVQVRVPLYSHPFTRGHKNQILPRPLKFLIKYFLQGSRRRLRFFLRIPSHNPHLNVYRQLAEAWEAAGEDDVEHVPCGGIHTDGSAPRDGGSDCYFFQNVRNRRQTRNFLLEMSVWRDIARTYRGQFKRDGA